MNDVHWCQQVHYRGVCSWYFFPSLDNAELFSPQYSSVAYFWEKCCVAKPQKRYVTVNSTTKRWNCHMLADNALHSANPGRKKENERTRLQTCHWLSKCQIRPSLSSLGRVSLCLLSFPIRKSHTPWETEAAGLITELMLYPQKNWALRSLWQSSCGIFLCGLSLTLCKELLASLRTTYP